MEDLNKRPYSRCMYGNYKRDDFSRSETLSEKSGTSYQLLIKLFCMGLILASIVIFSSCRTQPPTVIQKEEIIWTYKDSITTRDSTVIIPIERYVDIVPIYDTLVLENSIAVSHSWVDITNHLLRGELKNKKAFEVKYVEVGKWRTKDSLVYVEKPIPYEVVEYKVKRPWWAWICLTWTIITILSIAWAVYRKFKP